MHFATHCSPSHSLITQKLAAVPQRPFIISGTVLDNILLGREHDAARLHEVLEASSLLPDLEALPQRELTEVRRAALTC